MALQRRSGAPISARLVALVLVPVLGLVAFSSYLAVTSWRAVGNARLLLDDVERVATLTPAALMIAEEMYLQGSIVLGRGFGVDVEMVASILGANPVTELVTVQDQLDAQLARLDPDDPARALAEEVALARAEAAFGRLPLEDTGYFAVATDLHAAAFEALGSASGRTFGLGGVDDAKRALTVLEAAFEVANASYSQFTALGLMAVAADDGPLLKELGAASGDLIDAAAVLDRLATGQVRDRWAGLDGAVRAGEEVVGNTLSAGGIGTVDIDVLAPIFQNTMASLDGYFALVVDTAERAADEARSLGASARAGASTAVAVAAGFVVVTMAVTALIARSIGSPLQRLADSAQQVRRGRLDHVDLPGRAPREVMAVVETLDEVVENLRLVEAQLAVLEQGDIDDPVLDRPVPGRLGESVHGSVARLSRAMGERAELADRLRHEASHDPLTGLPNRSAASHELARAMAGGDRAGTSVALFYVDLDEFKRVNDNHGHDAGDEVLRVTAVRLRSTVRAGDFVARIGGDEFLVITEDAAEVATLVELGERIVDELSRPIAVGAATTRVGASVGIALDRDGERDADALLRDADLAGYEAKARGRGRVEVFDEELRAMLVHDAEIERALRIGLDEGALELHFQPVIDADGGRVTGVEALLRWHRDGTLVMPGEFIPIAEASGLIIDVGRWVLDAACAQLAAWSTDPVVSHLTIAVNLSGRHVLSMTVVDDVQAALERHGVAPHRLIVEITETVLLTDLPLIREHLSRLRRLGVSVALDDFGTGYTSLSHLRSLPVDILKIDRSLVVSSTAAADVHVLSLIVGTAHTLGMRLIAEGIEDEDQLERMRNLGCDQLQGYLIARPASVADLRPSLDRPLAPVALG